MLQIRNSKYTKYSKYSKEFKDSTVQLIIINNNASVVKVAQDLDINEKSLTNWVSSYKKAHNIAIRNSKYKIFYLIFR